MWLVVLEPLWRGDYTLPDPEQGHAGYLELIHVIQSIVREVLIA